MGRWQELQQAMSAGVEAAIDAGGTAKLFMD